MNYDYQKIRDLFNLNVPDSLPEKQITEIKDYFGAIPKALEDYYRLCGGCKEMNSAQDFLLTPDGIYSYKLKTWNYSDYCVFYVENQCCVEWAIKKSDLNMENPPVYETYDSGETWGKICDSVSQYLFRMLICKQYFHLNMLQKTFLKQT